MKMEFFTPRVTSELNQLLPLLTVDENVDKAVGRRVVDNMKIHIKTIDVETFILERLDLVQSFLNTIEIVPTSVEIMRIIIENVAYIVNKIFTTINDNSYIDEITIIDRNDLFCNIKEWMIGFVVEEIKDDVVCKKRGIEQKKEQNSELFNTLKNIRFNKEPQVDIVENTNDVQNKQVTYNTLTILVDLIEFEKFIWHLLYVQRDSIDGGVEILFNPEINEASKNICSQKQTEFIKNCRKKNNAVPLLKQTLSNLLKPDKTGLSICSSSGGHEHCVEKNFNATNPNREDDLVVIDDSVNVIRRIRFIIETLVYLHVDKLVTTITEVKLLSTRFSILNRKTTSSDGSGSTAYKFGIIDIVDQVKFTKFLDRDSVIKNVANKDDIVPNKRKRQDNIFINGGATAVSFSTNQ
jgi:hypothetical protein